uniref:Connector enhancer of kinase suppressor of Ras 1 n=1 Tax=Callithrix jacchus TaxID=9483 RepID=A0A8I3WG07_CALJA
MEPVETWTPGKVAAWLRGLDDSLQDYLFEDWQLPGKNLLQLCPRSLKALAVRSLGHQELILGGVEQLQALSSRLQTENLQSLTEGLLGTTHDFQSVVQGRLGDCAETPVDVLCAAVELVHKADALLFWLHSYLFSHLNDFSACHKIRDLLEELSQVLHENGPVAEKEGTVLRICSHVAGICHNILVCCPKELLEQRAVLEQVQLDSPLGLEIRTTSNCQHFVSQVDTQVGWPHENMVRELLREPAGLSLVLMKIPMPETPQQVPASPPPSCLQTPPVGTFPCCPHTCLRTPPPQVPFPAAPQLPSEPPTGICPPQHLPSDPLTGIFPRHPNTCLQTLPQVSYPTTPTPAFRPPHRYLPPPPPHLPSDPLTGIFPRHPHTCLQTPLTGIFPWHPPAAFRLPHRYLPLPPPSCL